MRGSSRSEGRRVAARGKCRKERRVEKEGRERRRMERGKRREGRRVKGKEGRLK